MSRFFTNRWSHIFLLLGLVLAGAFYSPSDMHWRQAMQHEMFDTLNRFFPREASGEVLIVDIDDDSLKSIGQWPWPRTEVAKLVVNLTQMGAKVIACLLYTSPSPRDQRGSRMPSSA